MGSPAPITPLTDAEAAFIQDRDQIFKLYGIGDRIQQLELWTQAQEYDFKGSARAATAAGVALPACTYANGASGVGATLTGNANGALAAQDGVTLVVDDRLLVKDQGGGASHLQNGIYVLTQVGTAGTPFILTRTTDADVAGELTPGFVVSVIEGTENAGTIWQHRTTTTPTVGTTALSFGLESVTFASVLAALATASSRIDINEQHILVGGVELEAGADLTLDAGGAIVPTHGQHRIIPFGGAGSGADTLATITATNFVDGGLLLLQAEGTAGDVLTIDGSGGGNILAPAGGNVALFGANAWALFFYDGTSWHLLLTNRSAEAVSFGTTEDALTIAGGSITPTGKGLVSCEAGAALTELDTIDATVYLPGQCIVLRPTTLNQVSRLTAAGNIDLPGGIEIEIGGSIDDRVMLMWDGTAWQVISVASGSHATPKHNFAAAADPVVGDDVDDGYGVGSLWLDTTGNVGWICFDASAGAAVWRQATDVAATETVAGRIEIATQTETNTGTDDVRAVTPLKLFTAAAPNVTKANGDSPYAVDLTADKVLLADTTGGDVQFDLPAVATSTGRTLRFKKLIAANNMILDGNAAETIDGAATQTFAAQWASVDLYCDGTQWLILG